MKRREFLGLSLGTAAVAALSSQLSAQAAVKEIRIGYQKTGVLVIARQQAVLEKHFAAQQIADDEIRGILAAAMARVETKQ